MELANQRNRNETIRPLGLTDQSQLLKLLQEGVWVHTHSDWHMLNHWLGTPGFVGLSNGRNLDAFLSVGADPMPAFWVRGAAFMRRTGGLRFLQAMLEGVIPWIRQQGGTKLAWMPLVDWPNQLLPQLGFKRVTEVVTLIKRDLEVPLHIRASEPVEIREVREDDLPALARIEAAAFTPIWRYGADGLNLARRQALSFDVALLEDKLVGYQVSTLSTYGAHLARMTVDPAVQRQGVGTTLMLSAIQSYRRANILNATLNTQMNNVASQRLYARFGYQMTTESVPVWVLAIN